MTDAFAELTYPAVLFTCITSRATSTNAFSAGETWAGWELRPPPVPLVPPVLLVRLVLLVPPVPPVPVLERHTRAESDLAVIVVRARGMRCVRKLDLMNRAVYLSNPGIVCLVRF